jgi:predicted Zn-dependent protease
MKWIRFTAFLLTTGLLATTMSCGDDDDDNGGGFVEDLLFPPENDVELGMQVKSQIEADTVQFPILSEAEYPEAYAYLNAMKNEILSSDDIRYRDLFPYELKIINQDVLNAFATPGGYMYVYTGLIKYLDNADDLAGVIGHEIAHADRRHSVDQMKQSLGVNFLISIALGEGTAADLARTASSFLSLKFSRDDESESDEFSVIYLGDTDYACNGAASFFEKLEAEGGAGVPEFLSTHPAPANRVADINAKATSDGCNTNPVTESGFTYEDFKNSLP